MFRSGAIPLRDLARSTRLPVPVVAAVRGELESRDILKRLGGLALTESGLAFCREKLGLVSSERFEDLTGLDPRLEGAAARLSEIASDRPAVDVRLDQSHATPVTAIRRAASLFESDALEGRDVLILGDDDLTSVAICLLAAHLEAKLKSLLVVECDGRLVDFLRNCHSELGSPANVLSHDLREELPESGSLFDVFLTDPPYTLPGLELFLGRGISRLRPEVGKQAFICFGDRSPQEQKAALDLISAAGLAPVEILPGFNEYVGAQVLGGVSQMIRAVSTGSLLVTQSGRFAGPIYTAELKAGQPRNVR